MKQLILILFLFGASLASGSSEYTSFFIESVHPIIKPPEKVGIQFKQFIDHLGLIESSNRWKIVNPIGMMGLYQFSQKTLEGLDRKSVV
jgi:hypothetical protein